MNFATPRAHHAKRLVAEAKPAVFWCDRPEAPPPAGSLDCDITVDLCIVGGGFTGLWAAVQALEEHPGRSVAVVEAAVAGFGASTRNGGFCAASLTHGFLNGLAHWPDEIATLGRLGEENLAGIIDTVARHGIEADVHRRGEISFALTEWQLEDQAQEAATLTEHGFHPHLLGPDEARALVHSPTYLGGLSYDDDLVLVDPARLVWGLQRVAVELGAQLYDRSRVTGIEADFHRLAVATPRGRVRAERVIVATNAWAEPERQLRRYIVPVYDHVLMTEPLSNAQMASIGWGDRQGLGDAANQFHYYRLTEDNRILWGGYDANYYFGNGMGSKYENRTASHELIAGHFFATFPQLEGLGFSHRWAGPIATTTKFAAAFGTRHAGRLAWAAGYTGLGVGASRFGARTALDLVDGRDTERTALTMVRKKPMPFPPEPLRSLAIGATRRAIARADRHGRPGFLLKTLDRFGVGFDS